MLKPGVRGRIEQTGRRAQKGHGCHLLPSTGTVSVFPLGLQNTWYLQKQALQAGRQWS